jgi:hypothetical protein
MMTLILRSIEAVFLYIVRQLHIGQYGQNIQILLLLTTTALQQHIIFKNKRINTRFLKIIHCSEISVIIVGEIHYVNHINIPCLIAE